MLRSIFILILFFPLSIIGQESVERLEQRMNDAQGEEQVRLMIELGNIYVTSDAEKSLELGLKAAFLSKRIGNSEYEGKALLLMGLSSITNRQSENALRYYNRALNHYERLNQSTEQIIALEGIAEVYNLALNFDMAINFLRRALTLAQTIKNTYLQVDIHERIGNISLNQKNYSNAHAQFTKVHELLGNEKNLTPSFLRIKANAYRKLGIVYRNQGEFDNSIKSYRDALRLERILENKSMEMKDIEEIAYSYFIMSKLDSSLIYYNRALAYYQLTKDSVNMVDVLQSIGELFFEREQYRQAVSSFNSSLELAQKLNIVPSQVSNLVSISRCFNALGDYQSSRSYLDQALVIAMKHNMTSSAADVYLYLSQINEQEGRLLQALEFYKLWADLRDSIYSEQSGEMIARMQILYEITQKERENEILRQNSEIQELQLTKAGYQRLGFIIFAIFLLILLLLLTFFFFSKQREYKKQKETELRIIEMNKTLEKRMISEIKKQEKQQLLLAQKSKLESLGILTAGIAHEINQPLGGISMGLDNILMRLSDDTLSPKYLKEKVSTLFENVDRIKRIIDHTRTFSRSHKPASFERVEVLKVIESALNMVKSQYVNHGIELEINISDDIEPIIADKFKLEQVVLNLLSNAKDAVDEKYAFLNDDSYIKRIKIESSQDDENVYIEVVDNGSGIKAKDIEKIFDPFYTTKKEDKGTGLGLSISYGFVKDLLGDISVESEEGEYTKFEIKIPKS
jgi:two-component system, NtrC family, sensor kinase